MRKIPPHLPAVLVLGVVSQIGQVLFIRELLMAFQGSELSIGLILASWLVWVGVGSYLGAYLVERVNRPLLLLSLTAAGIVLMLPVSMLLMRGLRVFFSDLPGTYLTLFEMSIACLLLMAPVCLLLGAQFVLLSRVWRERDQALDTSAAGKTYVGEALGNMFGGLLFTLLMVQYLNAFQSAVLVSMLMPASVLFLTAKMASRQKRIRFLLAGLLVASLLAYPSLKGLDDWAYELQWRYFIPQHQLVETHQSKHGVVSVLERENQYTFYQSGHLVFSTAGPHTLSSGLEEQEALVFAHFSMVQHVNPESVLLIGGGLRGVLGEIIKHPVKGVDYIELDEVLTKAALPYVSPKTEAALSDPRVRLIHTDGRLFVKSAQEKYDMILVDVPDPTTAVLNRYYTREFFNEANAILKPEGVFVIATMSTADLRGRAIANRNTSLYHTLSSVFSRVLPAGERFMFYFASNSSGQISIDADLLQARYLEREIHAEGFSAQHYYSLLPESQLRRVNWIVRNHGRSQNAHLEGPGVVPLALGTVSEQERAESQLPPVEKRYFINSDFKPIAYYYTLVYLDDLTRINGSETLGWLLQFRSWWILPFLGFPLIAVFFLRVKAGRREVNSDTYLAILFAVFTTGFSTMALQIALLFSFQSIYGFVYELVGLIVAIFMAGLALGAYLTNWKVKVKANINYLAAVQLLIGLTAALIAVFLPSAAALQSATLIFALFSGLTFIAGLINGVDFPLSLACCMNFNKRAEKSAGVIYGVELLGACIGAALASIVLAPILGIITCCVIASIANCTAFGGLMISRRV
jgi:spermidine synthase